MKRFILCLLLACFCALPAVGTEYEVRTWTDKSDRKLRAAFVELGAGQVKLCRESDSKHFDIPLQRLSTADLVYLRKIRKEYFEKIEADKTQAEEKIASAGGLITLYDEDAEPIPAGFTKRFRSPFTATRSVAYSDDARQALVWGHNNEALLWDAMTGRLLKSFKGNTSGAEVVAFSGDGRRNVAGAGSDVLVRDTLTGEVLHKFEGHTGFVTPVAMSPDGRLALSGAADKTAILWDVETGTLKHKLVGHKGRILSVTFHPKGFHVLTGDDEGTAIQWSIDSGTPAKTIDSLRNTVTSVSYNQDGAVAMLITPGTALLWDTYVEPQQRSGGGSGRTRNPIIGERATLPLVEPGDASVREGLFDSVAFSRDNSFFMLVSKVGNVYFGNLKTQTWVRKIDSLESGVNRAAFNEDASEYLTVSFNDNAIFWANGTGQRIAEFEGFNYCVSPIRMTRDGRRILTSGGWGDPTIAVWETTTGRLLKRLEGHSTAVQRIEISPDGKRLLSVAFEPFDPRRHAMPTEGGKAPNRVNWHVILWDISTGTPLLNLDRVSGWAFAPNGSQLITATSQQDNPYLQVDTITFWDTRVGRKQREVKGKGGIGPITIIDGRGEPRSIGGDYLFHPDGNRILAKNKSYESDPERFDPLGIDAALNWVARSGKPGGEYRTLQYDVRNAVFTPDGRRLLTTAKDGTAVLWNLNKGEPAHVFRGKDGAILSLAISSDGKRILTGSVDQTATLWDAETGSPLKTYRAGDGPIVGVDFTRDGRLVMVASQDGTVVFGEN